MKLWYYWVDYGYRPEPFTNTSRNEIVAHRTFDLRENRVVGPIRSVEIGRDELKQKSKAKRKGRKT